MFTPQTFCPGCGKFVQLKEKTCGERGFQYKNDSTENHFFSKAFGTPNTDVMLQLGSKLIDRFRISRYLDKGRFSTVYLAVDMLHSRDVALKVVEIGPYGDDMASVQLNRELSAYRNILNFRHIVKVHDLNFVPWGETGLSVLSMEYANGGTFRQFLRKHSDDMETRKTLGIRYVKQACRGISDAHNAIIIHLDVKPENLLFFDDVLKVSDFGTAQPFKGSSDLCLENEVGTPAYMSPEQFMASHADELDVWSDIYSIGVILFELLHPKCRLPFSGSFARLRDLHLNTEAPKLPEAGEKYASVIAKCLEKNPSDRYQSVQELLDALNERDEHHHGESDESKARHEEKQTAELDETWRAASMFFSKCQFSEADYLTDQILKKDSGHAHAQQLKKTIRDRFIQAETFYQEIQKDLEGGDLSQQIELLKEAIDIYPNHPSGRFVQSKLAGRGKKYSQNMEDGLMALQKKHWGYALDCFQKARQAHPGVENLRIIMEMLEQIEDTQRALNQAIYNKDDKKSKELKRSINLQEEQILRKIRAVGE